MRSSVISLDVTLTENAAS